MLKSKLFEGKRLNPTNFLKFSESWRWLKTEENYKTGPAREEDNEETRTFSLGPSPVVSVPCPTNRYDTGSVDLIHDTYNTLLNFWVNINKSYNLFFLLTLERERGRERKTERERERKKHWYAVPLIYVLIGCFFYVPRWGIEPTTLAYSDNVLTNWPTWPGLQIILNSFFLFLTLSSISSPWCQKNP